MEKARRQERPARSKMRDRITLFNIRAGGIDITFLVLVLLLLTIGLVMLFSSSYAYAYYNLGDSFAFISSQVVYGIVGTILMLLISTVDFRIFYKMAVPLMAVTYGLLVVVLFFEHDGARRWIDLGFTTFQPSEIAKFSLVIMFAFLSTALQKHIHTFLLGILPFGGILLGLVILMMLEPHLSGTMLLLGIGVIMMIVGGVNMKYLLIISGIMIGLLGIIVMIPGVIGYAAGRFEFWLDPWKDPQGAGFQTIQSLYAIGSGGLMGVGIGSSRQKYLYLPEPQNDFIFSIVCEELGFVGATLIIVLFALLVWRGFVIAMRCKDRFGSLVAVGLTSQVGLQTILNIMVVTNTIPNTGISLPFFSYGGTALIMLLCQMGVVLSISRHTAMEKQ